MKIGKTLTAIALGLTALAAGITVFAQSGIASTGSQKGDKPACCATSAASCCQVKAGCCGS